MIHREKANDLLRLTKTVGVKVRAEKMRKQNVESLNLFTKLDKTFLVSV